MIAWLLRLLGVSAEITEHLEHVSLSFQRPGLLGLGLLLLVPLSYYIWRRQRQNLPTAPPFIRAVLTVCRVLILTLIALVAASPFVKLDHRYEKRPIVAVLIDHSRSMHLPAGPFESDAAIAAVASAAGFAPAAGSPDAETRKTIASLNRAQLVHAIARAAGDSFAKPVSEKFDLRVYSVGDALRPLLPGGTAGTNPAGSPETNRLGTTRADSGAPREAGGLPATVLGAGVMNWAEPPTPAFGRSELGRAITTLIEEAAGRPIAGAILLSDGQNTGTTSLSQAAVAAARAGMPVFPMPAGSTARFRDVGIVDVYTSGLVSKGDTARVAVTIETQGFDGRRVQVELLEGDKTLDSEPLTLRSVEQQHLELTFEAAEVGPHYLTVRIAPLEEEVIRENNQDIAFLRVTDEKLKVLLLDGLPRWDFRFVKNGIKRDHGIEATVLVETELKTHAAGLADALPSSVDDWAKLHTVILGDVSRDVLTSSAIERLAEAVREHGVGLIVAAGTNHMPHAYDRTELDNLLPVRMRAGAAGYDAAAFNAFRVELTPEGQAHEPLRLFDEPGRNVNMWSAMPGYYWCAAVARPAAGATVLATNPTIADRFGKLPLIAYHYAGKGRVMFLGTDSTWLWRQNVGDRYFYKFWGQTIRFVARAESSDKDRLEVRPVRPQPAELATVELYSYLSGGTPRTDPRLTVRVTGPSGDITLDLDADPTHPGKYIGQITPREEGAYVLRYEPRDGREPVQAEIRVMAAPEELRRPGVDRQSLEMLANATDGRLLELGDFPKLPELLKGEPQLVEIHREQSVWDNWFVLSLIVLLYSIDVGIRRLVGLS